LGVKPGDILCDKYRIDALIGRGGMGHVFAATTLGGAAGPQVAIKIVSRLFIDDVMMERLHREAQAAQRIRSEFVPRVLEVSDTDDGETFLVMERLIGESLSHRIRDKGALPWSEVARTGEDVLRGLIDAHTAGIVHRDLKPSNVFLALKKGEMRAMVLDFGVCKMDGLDTERLTGTGESIGTVAYMAPEQIRGASRVDERADLYAFGALVFEMLSGRLPHDGPSQMAILASKLEKPATRLRDCTRVTIPGAIDELVARTLEREPERRFSNAQELLKAWRSASKGDPVLLSGRPASADDDASQSDAPTEVLRASSPPEDMVDTADDLAAAARSAAVAAALDLKGHSSFPPEPPTQTALTTHAWPRRGGGGARAALYLAAFGLFAGVGVVGISVVRGGPGASPPTAIVPTTDLSAELSAAPLLGERNELETDVASSPSADEAASFELPANLAQPATGGRPKPLRLRRPPPHPSPAPPIPKASGPHITPLPRY
jgi:serine/threonine-protein kinase